MKENSLKAKYVNGDYLQFFPGEGFPKYGYIRDVDEFGFTYEVIDSWCGDDRGVFFRSHSCGFAFRKAEKPAEKVAETVAENVVASRKSA